MKNELWKKYIDDTIVIDFRLTKTVQNAIQELEECILKDNAHNIDLYQDELYGCINGDLEAYTSNQAKMLRAKYYLV